MLLNADGSAVTDEEVFKLSLEYHGTGRHKASLGKCTGEDEYAFEGDRHNCAAQRPVLDVYSDIVSKRVQTQKDRGRKVARYSIFIDVVKDHVSSCES